MLNKACGRIILSDGAASLPLSYSPSTWQMFPPGAGVLQRSQDIIFERARDLGYRVVANHPDVKGFAYIELNPSPSFDRGPLVLPQRLVEFLARLRTDLDSFSDIEISALAYHGYSLIGRCLHTYHPDWIDEKGAEARFSLQGIEGIDWEDIARGTPGARGTTLRCARHLEASDSRLSFWRTIRRGMNSLTPDDNKIWWAAN